MVLISVPVLKIFSILVPVISVPVSVLVLAPKQLKQIIIGNFDF